MSDVKKVAELSADATAVLTALRASDRPLTLAEIKTIVPTAAPAHLNALRTRGLVDAADTEVEVMVKKTVLAYSAK